MPADLPREADLVTSIDKPIWIRRWPALLAVLAGIFLVAVMFLPWIRTIRPEPVDSETDLDTLRSSGWQLSRGQVESIAEQQIDDPLEPRRWTLLGLAVPIGLLVVGGMTLVGVLPNRWGGRILLLLGLVGLTVMLAAGFAVELPARPVAADPELSDTAEAYQTHRIRRRQIAELVTTRPGMFLWFALGVYAVVVAAGAISAFGAGGGQRPLTEPRHSESQPPRKQPYPAGQEKT